MGALPLTCRTAVMAAVAGFMPYYARGLELQVRLVGAVGVVGLAAAGGWGGWGLARRCACTGLDSLGSLHRRQYNKSCGRGLVVGGLMPYVITCLCGSLYCSSACTVACAAPTCTAQHVLFMRTARCRTCCCASRPPPRAPPPAAVQAQVQARVRCHSRQLAVSPLLRLFRVRAGARRQVARGRQAKGPVAVAAAVAVGRAPAAPRPRRPPSSASRARGWTLWLVRWWLSWGG